MIKTIRMKKKWLKVILGLIIVGLLLAVPFMLGLPERISQVFEQEEKLLPIYYVDTPEKRVAISFDATWGAERTPKILDILSEYDIKTTYFVTGIWTEEYPEWVMKIAEEGHELGNHTDSHPHLNELSAEQIEEELKKVEDMVLELTGKRTRLFRPPFGEYNNNVIKTADKLGYKTIQWSIDSLDWKNLSADAIFQRVTANPHNGAIILFHNDGLNTPDALPEIIEFYTENGYEIVPVSDLIYKKNYTIDPNSGAQKPNPAG